MVLLSNSAPSVHSMSHLLTTVKNSEVYYVFLLSALPEPARLWERELKSSWAHASPAESLTSFHLQGFLCNLSPPALPPVLYVQSTEGKKAMDLCLRRPYKTVGWHWCTLG